MFLKNQDVKTVETMALDTAMDDAIYINKIIG